MVITGLPPCVPRVLYVGPGLISAYGTEMSRPQQSSAISRIVEASIVADRRGMARQYGTRLRGGPAEAHEPGRAPPEASAAARADAGGLPLHGVTEALVGRERLPVAARTGCPSGPRGPQRGEDSGDQRNDPPREHTH